ncbi:MAG: hypothetical protein JJU22_14800, partial [Gammaproteobacteria bacterium]|nr:hypothetical protein [Gammaproteobacteria bacterium]
MPELMLLPSLQVMQIGAFRYGEIALSHRARRRNCGKALIAKRLGRSRRALPELMLLPSLQVMQIGAF